MSVDFVAHCRELLAPFGPVRVRRMFGGHGFYVDDLFIGMVADERFYLKVDAATRARFEAAGSQPFTYAGRHDQVVVMSYSTAPDEALEAPDAMRPWAQLAIEAALRARAPAPKKAAARKAPARKKATTG